MSDAAEAILAHLQVVAGERARRDAEPALAARVDAVKRFQHRRFEETYRDLLAQPRYAAAARFFLDDLYGPHDFSDRDAQFARIVPALVRLFPREIVATVRALGELHALSEKLDTAMGEALPSLPVDPAGYALAWRCVGQREARDRQVALMLEVGAALDRYTRHAMLRHTLRAMRGPARAAGLAALQAFLETGFETFRAMRGADTFLATVAERERALAAALFSADSSAVNLLPRSA